MSGPDDELIGEAALGLEADPAPGEDEQGEDLDQSRPLPDDEEVIDDGG